jgi:hypothetical protein
VCAVVVVVITYSCVCLLTGVLELPLAVSVMRLVNFFLVYHLDLGSYVIVFEMIVVLMLIVLLIMVVFVITFRFLCVLLS